MKMLMYVRCWHCYSDENAIKTTITLVVFIVKDDYTMCKHQKDILCNMPEHVISTVILLCDFVTTLVQHR